MIIKEVAFGNGNEAFIENRLQPNTNIIFSDDNNKGKTLLMQSIVYSMGYESIFPSGFDAKEYYFYSKVEFGKKQVEFLRRGNAVLIINDGKFSSCGSISELKYFLDKNVFKLPKIDKDGELKSADLSLLYELFFLGQDKRNTSNIIARGQNNKTDFMNMIYAFKGIAISTESKFDIENLKKQKTILESKIKSEIRKIGIIKKNPEIASFISSSSNNVDFQKMSSQLNELNHNIFELKKSRNREENRKIKLEALINELNSLNRSLSEGEVSCSNCGSTDIVFTSEEFVFDVSNQHVRENILNSIKENIALKDDIIIEHNKDIYKHQENLNKLLSSTPPSAQNYILFKDEIIDSTSMDKVVLSLQEELADIDKMLRNNDRKIISNKEQQQKALNDILSEMMVYYTKIDPAGLLTFEDVFTKSNQTYSGSEEQEYYFCKIIALNNVLKHDFPIIIDSFREGELSSAKEDLMINEFKKINKQIILTSTLKREEYSADKYYNIAELNVLDYSDIPDSKILRQDYAKDFKLIIKKFGIDI